jgi:hypothetical protein
MFRSEFGLADPAQPVLFNSKYCALEERHFVTAGNVPAIQDD